jgi:CelD/BcsL family acetyltransferase involved in cellulose biosynthesis
MLLPLGIYRRHRLRLLQFLGGGITDYHAPIIDRTFAAAITQPEFARLWSAILKLLPPIDVVSFWNMPETIDGARNPMLFLAGVKFFENAHAATLPRTFDEFKSGRRNGYFKDTRRRQRRLAERGQVEIRVAANVADGVELVRIMARQKSRRWRETGARDMFGKPEYLAFYETLTKTWLPAGGVQVRGLKVDNQIIATDWGLLFKNRFYSLMAGYEGGEWRPYSPGRILLASAVEWCIAAGDIEVFDLTVGDESYKRDWADHALRMYDYWAARSAKGFVHVAAERVKALLRQNALVRSLRRRLKGIARKRDGAAKSATAPAVE